MPFAVFEVFCRGCGNEAVGVTACHNHLIAYAELDAS